MSRVQTTVNVVLEKQKQKLAPSTYDARKNHLICLAVHAEKMGIDEPYQELFDSYIARASAPDLWFQLLHAVRLVDKEAGSKAFTPKGKLYNEPELPPSSESGRIFETISFPIADDSIDIGYLIHRAESELNYLQLSSSTRWQYMQAWRELYTFLYLCEDTLFNRTSCNAFIEDANQKHQDGILHEWKRKIRRRATLVLLEVADTGHFEWKLFHSRKVCCAEESLEELRQQYLSFLRTQNLENRTIDLYDYAFRSLIEGLGIGTVAELAELKPKQIQGMVVFLSRKLNRNSRGTVFPIVRQILTFLDASGFVPADYFRDDPDPCLSAYASPPYITTADEKKLYQAMAEAPLRTKAMM